MCGIAGFCISDREQEVVRNQLLAKHLFLQIVKRGTDASGMAWTQDDGAVYYAKDNVAAHNFLPNLESMPRNSRLAILHTRYATKGDPIDEHNNHPIVVPSVVGVHNGHINNDDELIEQYGGARLGEVDSEAIFHLIANSDQPVLDLLQLQGRAAVAWIHVDEPTVLHLARVSGSPLAVGWTKGGSLVFASTSELLNKAAFMAGITLHRVWNVPEYTYLRVENGQVTEMVDIWNDEFLNAELVPF